MARILKCISAKTTPIPKKDKIEGSERTLVSDDREGDVADKVPPDILEEVGDAHE